MLDLVFLSKQFYSDYANGFDEIEQKPDRPYARVVVNVDGVLWCIPFRSHINHPNVILTDAANRCGIDLSKAVVIVDPQRHIDQSRTPHLRSNEFQVVKSLNPSFVALKMRQYIAKYKKAKQHLNVYRNRNIVKCSTLQYFENYI